MSYSSNKSTSKDAKISDHSNLTSQKGSGQICENSCPVDFMTSIYPNDKLQKDKKHSSVLIVSAYIDFSEDKNNDLYYLKKRISKIDPDYIICTDSGYEIAKELELTPNLVVGDFDSSTGFSANSIPDDIEMIPVPVEKDFTDMEMALDLAVKLSPDHVNIIGGLGGRLDHTVANMQNIAHFSSDSLIINIFDSKNFMTAQHPGTRSYSSVFGHHFSAFALTEKVTGLTYSGAYYPLNNDTLYNTLPLGVSNSFIENEITVTIDTGILIVIISKCK